MAPPGYPRKLPPPILLDAGTGPRLWGPCLRAKGSQLCHSGCGCVCVVGGLPWRDKATGTTLVTTAPPRPPGSSLALSSWGSDIRREPARHGTCVSPCKMRAPPMGEPSTSPRCPGALRPVPPVQRSALPARVAARPRGCRSRRRWAEGGPGSRARSSSELPGPKPEPLSAAAAPHVRPSGLPRGHHVPGPRDRVCPARGSRAPRWLLRPSLPEGTAELSPHRPGANKQRPPSPPEAALGGTVSLLQELLPVLDVARQVPAGLLPNNALSFGRSPCS